MGSLAFIPVGERPLAVNIQALSNQFVRLDILKPNRVLACAVSRSSLFDRIRECQYDDPHLLVLNDTVQHSDARDVTIGDDGVLRMQGRICVPNVDGLRELILEKAHSSQYSIYQGCREDVPKLEVALLVEKNEEGYSGVCSSVPKLPAGEVWEIETGRIDSDDGDSKVEI
ncbi:uncharacterized protein [Nicotiana tomentosiformis]|uniref:uncharacterized protein n=1 Tax=Nicotiana tomentosiformis TaxID=4098 RepID=UPI00388C7C18